MFKNVQGKMILIFFLVGIILIGSMGAFYINSLNSLIAQANGQAIEVINELRNRDYDIKFEDFLLIVNRIMENKEYLKSQGTLREIVRTLAVVLDYPKVVERLDGMSLEDDDESPGKN